MRRCHESVLQAHDGSEWERSVAARIGPPRAIASTTLKKSSCSRFVIRYVTGFASRTFSLSDDGDRSPRRPPQRSSSWCHNLLCIGEPAPLRDERDDARTVPPREEIDQAGECRSRL
ncbi:hypothetical protein Bcep1808_3894 [Burkholderia vietnamiensis G4]|uniref:Uncharacterized protein n=1 Tax=Burkholderia vietnamiensis (strain G4 / LMG 22486) TaxID=269482 RepID=A4JKS2_BURVG|nr:hypothetical protein Bcep1808_3894 [Burkholderia vietnamiensis G4]